MEAGEIQGNGDGTQDSQSDTEAATLSMAPSQRQPPAKKRTVANADDWEIFLDYIEDETIFAKLFNSGRQTLIGGKYVKKSAQWEVAAAELNGRGFKVNGGDALQKKWQRYFTKYKGTRRLSQETGWGLDEEEVAAGITIEDKLDGLCAHFNRIDALFGSRCNVNPPAVSQRMGFQQFAPPTSVPSSQTPPPTPSEIPITTPSFIEDIGDNNCQNPATPLWVQEQANSLQCEAQYVADPSDNWNEEDEEMVDDDVDGDSTPPEGFHQDDTPANDVPVVPNLVADDVFNNLDPAEPIPEHGNSRQQTPHTTPTTATARNGPAAPSRKGNAVEAPASANGVSGRAATAAPLQKGRSKEGPASSNGASNGAAGKSKSPPGTGPTRHLSDQDKAKLGAKEKPSLASVFQESKTQEANLKLKYFEKKGEWKSKELDNRREELNREFEDRREARNDDYLKRKYELEFQANEKKDERFLQCQESKKDRLHKAKVAKDRNKLDLIMAGWSQNKPQEEITWFLNQL